MKTVWFIRHAESDANAGLPTAYPNSIALTQKGFEQAKVLSDSINVEPDLVIFSSYTRTQQTAQPLLEKFPTVKTEIWPIHEFDFLSPTKCINTTVEQRKPWVNDYWERCEADYVHGVGAESFADFKGRVVTCLKRLEEIEDHFVVVFAHGHVMRAIWQYFITANANVDNACMQYFRDKMRYLPVSNIAVLKLIIITMRGMLLNPYLIQIKFGLIELRLCGFIALNICRY